MDISHIANLISYLSSFEVQQYLFPLKVGFLVLSLFFFLAILFLLLRTQYLKIRFFQSIIEFLTYRPYGFKRIIKVWARVTKRLETASEAEYKLSIIEAEEILNNILEKMGYEGETIEDRLKQLVPPTITNLDQVWEIHKIRNNIVYNPDYRLSLDEAKRILEVYEQALRELQVF